MKKYFISIWLKCIFLFYGMDFTFVFPPFNSQLINSANNWCRSCYSIVYSNILFSMICFPSLFRTMRRWRWSHCYNALTSLNIYFRRGSLRTLFQRCHTPPFQSMSLTHSYSLLVFSLSKCLFFLLLSMCVSNEHVCVYHRLYKYAILYSMSIRLKLYEKGFCSNLSITISY